MTDNIYATTSATSNYGDEDSLTIEKLLETIRKLPPPPPEPPKYYTMSQWVPDKGKFYKVTSLDREYIVIHPDLEERLLEALPDIRKITDEDWDQWFMEDVRTHGLSGTRP